MLRPKRDIVRSIKLTEQEDDQLVAMARQLGLPTQELLRRGGFKEGKRLIAVQRKKLTKTRIETILLSAQ